MNRQIFITLLDGELAIMQFIHEFGFCEIHHIMKRFCLRRTFSYEQMRILIRFGLIIYKVVVPHFPGVYFLTAKSVRLINTDLPLMTYVPIYYYGHHMAVLSVYLKIREKYPNATWMSERRLIKQKYDDMAGNKEHLPDGLLVLPDSKRIPIEVELNLKSRERLNTILSDYSVDKNVHEVWYFCTPEIKCVLQELIVKLPKIKLYLLDEEVI
jgi:hypothetical protein